MMAPEDWGRVAFSMARLGTEMRQAQVDSVRVGGRFGGARVRRLERDFDRLCVEVVMSYREPAPESGPIS